MHLIVQYSVRSASVHACGIPQERLDENPIIQWMDPPPSSWDFLSALVLCLQERLDEDPLFQRLSDEELEGDPAAGLLTEATEEGQKVARNNGEVRP